MLAASVAALTALPARAQTLEQAVLDRINAIRADPHRYADELRDYRRYFRGRLLLLPGDDAGVITREGTSAVDEAIDFLERQAPLPPLDPGALLARAAKDYALDQGALGANGHVDRHGAGPGERVRRIGGGIFVGEGIAYGADDPDAVVRQLIIDDGVPGRGHRALLFDANFRFVGIGCGPHRRLAYLCVLDLSGTSDGTASLPQFASTR
ncbi:CAP domain-containing protein [Sphingomonas sp. RS6]